MSIQFNVCPLNHVSILREMFTDRMKSNIWWRCCVTATHWIAPPGTDAIAWYVFCLRAVQTLEYLHHQSQLIRPLRSFWLLAHLPSQLLLHVVEVLAVFVHQAQQFNHVLCWIAELKEKSGSTILRTQRSSALITCYSTLTKVFLNWSSADPWFSSLCCPPTFCPPLLFSTLTISETTRIEMSF